jgi:hypothetical protein
LRPNISDGSTMSRSSRLGAESPLVRDHVIAKGADQRESRARQQARFANVRANDQRESALARLGGELQRTQQPPIFDKRTLAIQHATSPLTSPSWPLRSRLSSRMMVVASAARTRRMPA